LDDCNGRDTVRIMNRSLRTLVSLALLGGALLAAAPVASASDGSPCGARWFHSGVGLDVQYCPDWAPNNWIPVWRSKDSPAVAATRTAAGSEQPVGYIYAPGNDWYHCEAAGRKQSVGNFWNTWWAWTMADNGQWGWVNEVYFQGGGNDEPDATLARC
jgi:hypothetical protein